MQCSSCGIQLPESGAYCPRCATLTPYGISQSQATPDDPTSVSSSPYPPPPPIIPATNYGSPSYGVIPRDPYESGNPYVEPRQLQTRPSKKHPFLIVLIAVIVVLTIIAGGLGIRLYETTLSPTAHYPFSTNLVLDDPLSNSSNALKYGWGVANNANGGCTFANGAYEITAHQNYIYCPTHRASFSNFTYETRMTIKTGNTGAMGGIIFRHALGTGKNYMFFLGVDGSYEFVVNTDYSSGSTLRSGMVPNFASGFNRPHTIGIVASGQEISIYVDQKQIIQVSDATYASGEIGMLSRYGSSSTTVAYTNAKVWQL
jgi:hypothetical protein